MEDKGKRLADAIEYLKEIGAVSNLEDVANKVDRSKNNISSAINGDKRYLSNKFLKHFNACFRNVFNLDWLIDGIGNMLNGCGCTSADTDTDDSFYHPSQKRTTSEPEAKEERRTSEDLLARENELLRQQVQFLKEQVEFYKNKKQ